MLQKDSKIYIAGHNGMVGSACWRALSNAGYTNLIGKSSKDLDLRNQEGVKNFLSKEKPYVVINAAAKVGGILANNNYPYEFLMDNMLIQNNLISSAHQVGISKFIFLGSSCIYPKFAPQPIKEEYLMTGTLESTNEWYAIAKISGVKLIQALRNQYNRDYFSIMPSNLYGPGDNFDLMSSHVMPALIRKFHEAKLQNASEVTVWGTGSPKREFLHVDDLANAVVFSMENNMTEHLYNVGFGEDLTIQKLSSLISQVVGFEGEIVWDKTKPDGTPRKILDSSKMLSLGWRPKINIKEGISATYKFFLREFYS